MTVRDRICCILIDLDETEVYYLFRNLHRLDLFESVRDLIATAAKKAQSTAVPDCFMRED